MVKKQRLDGRYRKVVWHEGSSVNRKYAMGNRHGLMAKQCQSIGLVVAMME